MGSVQLEYNKIGERRRGTTDKGVNSLPYKKVDYISPQPKKDLFIFYFKHFSIFTYLYHDQDLILA